MARPRKNKLPETNTPEVEALVAQISGVVKTSTEASSAPVAEPAPVATPAPVVEEPQKLIQPEADRHEMNRYFCVINNSDQASRIMQSVSHQRDLEMWGVHQYDNNRSRNSYARSFYFKNVENAKAALEHASKLLG